MHKLELDLVVVCFTLSFISLLDRGLIFRDLKPENVLIGRRSFKKENILHVIDYGLAKPYIDSETR